MDKDAREQLKGTDAQQPIYADASDYGGDYEEVVEPPDYQDPPSFSGSGGGEDYEEVAEPLGQEEVLYDNSADLDQDYEEIPGRKPWWGNRLFRGEVRCLAPRGLGSALCYLLASCARRYALAF